MPTASRTSTLFDTLLHSSAEYAERTAFIYRAANSEFEVSYQKLFEDALILAKAFASKKVRKGSKVMLLSDNRYGWIVTDFALLSLGAVSVPRGSDTPTKELQFILDHAECEFLVIETAQLLKAHEEMLKKLKKLRAIFIIEGEKTHKWFDSTYSYNDILDDRRISQGDRDDFIARRYAVTLQDPFTLIYTSGTTGTPKGVLLTHQNIMHNVNTLPELIDLREDDRWVSILPSWHIFERAAEYLALSRGCCTVYSTIKTFAADLESYKPTLVATVPRLWESMYSKINTTLEKQDPKKARIFKKLVQISSRYRYHQRRLRNHLPIYQKPFFLKRIGQRLQSRLILMALFPLYKFALKKLALVQEKFGGRLRMAISGGGSLPPYLDEWIDAIGIRIVNAYGMTECAPAIAGRALNCEIFGTLGPPIKETELQIVDEEGKLLPAGEVGEIQLRGPQVFPGYYKNDEENAKAFTEDGFFKTGDLGKLTLTGELVITGRSKEIIVLANGENIDPSNIESTITQLPFVKDAVLVGQDKKGLGALIVPDFEQLRDFVGSKFERNTESDQQLMENKQVLDRVKAEMNRLLHPKKGFKPFEKLQNIHFLDKEFKAGEELTNTLKKKRHVIETKYREIIGKLLK
ncbi:long-chain acyl-CoA synthetase [Malonomonas rubra DSM 5091]|uniref:Long-chain acyl-CoA synthetase n=1 Tax=Malonomonas rubra DSM 5091 TaxID=1122189 RepID=A0A1M6MDK3_MALRU|nr:long-chain fatty acid--CoA ligase [Malonomonas rubra]SHJ81534.1 long-chain acyl-CoA synthetase [Malonomonas rubra DSM 5091]